MNLFKDDLAEEIGICRFMFEARDFSLKLVDVSPECRRISGYSRKEFLQNRQLLFDIIHPGDRDKLFSRLKNLSAGKTVRPFEFRIVSKRREIKWLRITLRGKYVSGRRLRAVYGLAVDISSQQHYEDVLREQEKLLLAVATASGLLLTSKDVYHAISDALKILGEAVSVDRIYVFENHRDPETGKWLATQRYEWSHESVEPQIENPDLQNASYEDLGMERWFKVLSRGGIIRGPVNDFPQTEQDVLKPQGIQSLLVFPIMTSSNEFWGFIGFDDCHRNRKWSKIEECILKTMAISIGGTIERQRTQQVISEEKKRLMVTLKSIGEGVITTDLNGRITLLNKTAEDLTGWKQDQAVGRRLTEVFRAYHEDRTTLVSRSIFKYTMRKKQPVIYTKPRILVSRDGSEKIVTFSIAPIIMHQERLVGTVLVFRDITMQRAMEEEVLKASKLESLGILAGGIAHDFNNILASITGNVSLAKLHLGADGELHQILTDIEIATQHARDLTLQLLTFAKGGEPIKKLSNMGELLRNSIGFILRGSRVKYTCSIAPDLYAVEVDAGQFQQVIYNLAINAQQAMPQGGTITIVAENYIIEGEHFSRLKPGPYVKITFTDQGIGIPKEHLTKIFDPYFSTKQQGSGLGLAICYSIINRHGGYIGAESELGLGTTFTILLPAKTDIVKKRLASPGTDIQTRKGNILIMDDEPLIRNVLTRMLKRIGYSVQTSASGEEAIRIYKEALEAGTRFDAVILDLTVPGGLGGRETFEQIRMVDQGVKAIVSSGYSNDPILADFRKYGFHGAVAKPFNIKELSQVLDEVLAFNSKPRHSA